MFYIEWPHLLALFLIGLALTAAPKSGVEKALQLVGFVISMWAVNVFVVTIL